MGLLVISPTKYSYYWNEEREYFLQVGSNL